MLSYSNVVFVYYFYAENTTNYLSKWIEWLHPLQKWEWVALKKMPQWDEIQKCVDDLIEKKIIDVSIEKDIHAEYAHLKSFIDRMIVKWKEDNTKADRRWLEVFDFLQTKDVSFENFAILIEYAFTIPGMYFIVMKNYISCMEFSRLFFYQIYDRCKCSVRTIVFAYYKHLD